MAPDPPLPDEVLGRLVRGVWCRWAREQPDPKSSWLTPWDTLDAGQREVDIRIGRAVAKAAALSEREACARLADRHGATYLAPCTMAGCPCTPLGESQHPEPFAALLRKDHR